MRRARTSFRFIGLAVAMVSAGCEDAAIRAYTVPKDPPIITPATPDPKANLRQLVDWTVPEGWRDLPSEGQFRLATFEAGSDQTRLEIGVTAFPDSGGGLANINRWRRQLGLGPINEDTVADHVRPFEGDGMIGAIVDMTGPKPSDGGEPANRLVGAILYDAMGIGWFVKAMDRPSVLDVHKDAIVRFAHSFSFQGSPHDHVAEQLPPQGEAGPEEAITWQKPPEWQADPSPSSIVSAAFNITDDSGDARITVTSLGGDGGGALANINRWRGQVGLPPVEKLEDQPATPFDVAGSPAAMLDLIGPEGESQGAKRILVALMVRPERTWYFKMTGPESVLDHQKTAFEQFVRSVRFQTDSTSETNSS